MNAADPLAGEPLGVTVSEAVRQALAEDIGALGDITSAVFEDFPEVEAVLVSRSPGVLAGRAAAEETFAQVDASISVEWGASDGDALEAGRPFAVVRGPLEKISAAERTALNFLCHLSGVATTTRRFLDAARAGNPEVRIRDTRKTTPGLRMLEKAAVAAAGGTNHRASLSGAILLKDNHLAFVSVSQAVASARDMWPGRTVQVECDTVDQCDQAVAAGADAVLLDNMSPEEVALCVARVDRAAVVEVSGGVTIDNIADYAAAGPEFIAVGAITHSAPALDIGLDVVSSRIDPSALRN